MENNCYDGAYYLSGYVIECALKAWIAKSTKEHDFPEKNKVNKIYTHDLTRLLGVIKVNRPEEIEISWSVVKDWSEKARYESHSRAEAENIFKAVSDSQKGVFQWIKEHW